jgi:hypothetical protein
MTAADVDGGCDKAGMRGRVFRALCPFQLASEPFELSLNAPPLHIETEPIMFTQRFPDWSSQQALV